MENQRIKTIKPAQEYTEMNGYFTKMPVAAAQYDMLKKNLQNEIIQLQKTNAEPYLTQAVYIARASLDLEERYKHKQLSYGDIYSLLTDLQNNVTTLRCTGNFFAKPAAMAEKKLCDAESGFEPAAADIVSSFQLTN
jgi:hypothetical protein